MTITKRTEEFLDEQARGCLGVRTVTIVEEAGVELSRSNHRKVLSPGEDVSGESEKIRAVSAALWTPEVVAVWEAMRATEADQ